MNIELCKLNNEKEIEFLKNKIAAGYATIVELYMSEELWYLFYMILEWFNWFNDQPDAESKCEEYCKKALDIAPLSIDSLQAIISLRNVQGKFDESKEYLYKLYNNLIKDIEDPELLPPYSNRYVVAKQAIALSEDEIAVDIIETLLNEDDSDPELWYRVAQCYKTLEAYDIGIEYCNKCIEMLKTMIKDNPSLSTYIDECNNLLKELNELNTRK